MSGARSIDTASGRGRAGAASPPQTLAGSGSPQRSAAPSAAGSPAAASTGAKKHAVAPEELVVPGEFKAVTMYGKTGEAMVARKLEREDKSVRLTKREEDDSIGDWLFGTGGIRGLRYASMRLPREPGHTVVGPQ
jgi:hypothetical protein